MDDHLQRGQRITRLTPLDTVLAAIAADVKPVAAQTMPLDQVIGHILAADVTATAAIPAQALALRDGIAVAAELTADAGAYAPTPLPKTSASVGAGEVLPAGCDAVAPFDAVAPSSAGRLEALASIAPGDGVLPPSGDAAAGSVLKRAGTRMRAHDIAALIACGIAEVPVRAPRLRLRRGGPADAIINASLRMLARVMADDGASVDAADGALDDALNDGDADVIVTIGGTGSGRRDRAVQRLGAAGRVVAHGIALAPGETMAFGFVGAVPVLMLPGRIDAALAVWLLLGRPLLQRLCGTADKEPACEVALGRKVTSSLGITELIPVRLRDSEAIPLGSGYLPAAALLQSDGWIVVPAESEGFQRGTSVTMRSWP